MNEYKVMDIVSIENMHNDVEKMLRALCIGKTKYAEEREHMKLVTHLRNARNEMGLLVRDE